MIRYNTQLQLKDACAVAVGGFDGVHLGHQKLLAQLARDSKAKKLKSLVCSFDPLPWQYFETGPENKENLTNLRAKLNLLAERHELDYFLLIKFNEQIRQISPQDFIQKLLAKQLNTKHLITGSEFRFGRNREGTTADLQPGQESLNNGLFGYSAFGEYPSAQDKIGSRNIRELLAKGKIEMANRLLGYKFYLLARIIPGNKLGGSKLGFATANLNLKSFAPPLKGVFACYAYVGGTGQARPAIANLGIRPTISALKNSGKFVAETHILDFEENLQGKLLKLEFVEKLRDEQKFESLDELSRQIQKDKEAALKIFS